MTFSRGKSRAWQLTVAARNRADTEYLTRIPDAWLRAVECSQTAKLVLLTLALFTGANRSCWPALPTLAKACCCSVNTVKSGIRELEQLGILTKQKRGNRQFEYTIFRPSIFDGHRPSDFDGQAEPDHQILTLRPSDFDGKGNKKSIYKNLNRASEGENHSQHVIEYYKNQLRAFKKSQDSKIG